MNLLLLLAVSAQPGTTFDVIVRSSAEKNRPQSVRVTVLGEKARVEFLEDSKETKKGDFAVTLDGGKSFALVLHGKKTIERQDAASLQRDADSEKDLDIKTATVSWDNEASPSPVFKQNLMANIKQGIFKIPASMNITVAYTLAPTTANRPAYNPMVALLVPAVSGLALKDKTFRDTKGAFVALPRGFAETMTLQMQIKSKIVNQDQRLTVETGPSSPIDVLPSAFELPPSYRVK